jgi:hypothetical protein
MSLKPSTKIALICLLLVTVLSACSQRYWFRKKSGSTLKNDSTIIEKDYQIVW